ncbi:bZIP transcription factor [Halosimplex rubrum]|uniref:BZIP transcription factor n=1 Tax=Halosimplex rubrum TaxID=869889 RepID=A0A7D5P4J7_9EURY|nr:bZIP transcription factor [Halosimplex rubrum]QLH77385.1 bZIP transcription factor [Halosimplex rubrum]
MCGNRVEELESRVKELEASVEGLTDELVECKVRLRELENAVDEDIGFTPDEAVESSESPDEVEADRTKTEATEEDDSTESGPGDIIIA